MGITATRLAVWAPKPPASKMTNPVTQRKVLPVSMSRMAAPIAAAIRQPMDDDVRTMTIVQAAGPSGHEQSQDSSEAIESNLRRIQTVGRFRERF